jgi:hypothetical protein
MNELFQTNIRVVISDGFPTETNCGTRIELLIPQKLNADA